MFSNLKCQANNCSFNKQGSCFASNIKIEGFDAKVTPETYCDTFRNASDYSLSNHLGELNLTDTQDISCSASSCKYNLYGGCNASHVDINFENESCETFSPK